MNDDKGLTFIHRVISPAEVARQHEGAIYLAPGLWRDREGQVHLSVPELMQLVDLPDTPANRAAVVEIAMEILQRVGFDTIVQQDPES